MQDVLKPFLFKWNKEDILMFIHILQLPLLQILLLSDQISLKSQLMSPPGIYLQANQYKPKQTCCSMNGQLTISCFRVYIQNILHYWGI